MTADKIAALFAAAQRTKRNVSAFAQHVEFLRLYLAEMDLTLGGASADTAIEAVKVQRARYRVAST